MSKNLFNSSFYQNASAYIPICCHYDNYTLLTKNGELIQTIQVNGINQENISKNLMGLRELIRDSIHKNMDTADVSCWLHTIRRKVNLDDPAEYPNIFSQNIHDIWVRKNYWDDKFINTLYISFVTKGVNYNIADAKSFIRTFSKNYIESIHNEFLEKSKITLENIVTKVTGELNEFGAERLGIFFDKDDNACCSMLSLFYGLLRGIEMPIQLGEKDLSKIIGSFDYAVGSRIIEVIENNKRKYGSILSLKEYQEIPTKTIARVLQQPTEFAITEIFHVVDNKSAKSTMEFQNYIAKVSEDDELLQFKKITPILETEKEYKLPFCNQQVSILLLNEDLNQLEEYTERTSFQLSRVGLVHSREDINIENAFWAQVPGNFKFLRRLKPTSIKYIGAMASLHNFPAGSPSNPWGRATTLLRTEKGTPFFFNFHDTTNNSKTLIIGNTKSGKTTLANFLVSEALKYEPSVLFICYAADSEVFIRANGGRWINGAFKIDPFKLEGIRNNQIFISEIIRAMTNDHNDPLPQEQKAILDQLIQYFINIPNENKNISKLGEFNFEGDAGNSLKQRLADYLPEGQYYDSFIEDNSWNENISNIISISVDSLSDTSFAKANYPFEDRLLPEYYKKFNKFSLYREIVTLAQVLKYKEHFNSRRKIIKIENFDHHSTGKFSLDFYKKYFEIVSDENSVYVNSLQFSPDLQFYTTDLWKFMNETFGTKIYLPAESIPNQWKDKLLVSDQEFNKLKSIIPATRLFIIKQQDLSITCELSIGGLIGIMKLMSCDKATVEKCHKLIQEKGEDPNNWLIELYDTIRM